MAEFVTVREASRISGYSVDHLRFLLRGGKIDGQRFGLGWKIEKNSLLAYVAKQGKESEYQR